MINLRYFSLSEFDQKGAPNSGEQNMCADFLKKLDELRHKCDFPLIISSGYRSPEYNAQVSLTGRNGSHTTGKAADILVFGEQAHTLLKYALELDFMGIGVSQKGNPKKRFIHLDILKNDNYHSRPWVWSY